MLIPYIYNCIGRIPITDIGIKANGLIKHSIHCFCVCSEPRRETNPLERGSTSEHFTKRHHLGRVL
jgi:hypothetical protein